jgi:hypothetical protein
MAPAAKEIVLEGVIGRPEARGNPVGILVKMAKKNETV